MAFGLVIVFTEFLTTHDYTLQITVTKGLVLSVAAYTAVAR
jgi:hypothetical protein